MKIRDSVIQLIEQGCLEAAEIFYASVFLLMLKILLCTALWKATRCTCQDILITRILQCVIWNCFSGWLRSKRLVTRKVSA